MFYQMITKARDRWLVSPQCTVTELIRYMEAAGKLRDAQVEAIKTYLFLKIAGGNQPLWQLFASGFFTSVNTDDLELKPSARSLLEENPAALALYEYACLTNDKDQQVSAGMEKLLKAGDAHIDYEDVFRDFFYGVSYSDYIFSLPMGAGKTYLMAAFIYLDLYFARAEPQNRAFSHNFIIFAPSGLKSSVVPSLKTIQNFDPAWVVPEPAASNLKRMVQFEVLDQQKSAKKSNRAKNPNVQKIAAHQPLDELMGLVLITNAEKVILDYIKVDNGQLSFLESDSGAQANELRKIIGKLPSLSIYVDEVHHVADDSIKLRAVINDWNHDWQNPNVTGVIGFSGTPYLDSPDPISVGDDLLIKNTELSNVVYYYTLSHAIGNFLKHPLVYISDNPRSEEIVAQGVREFLTQYGNTVYQGGLTAKLAIYCGQIIPLEEVFLPIVNEIVGEFGMNPNDVVLKYYGKSSTGTYACPPENATEFAALDTPLSHKKIILLAQIGKEGWDCRSLTGVILSQKGACPTNMVLQTSCRCLRQVTSGNIETAGIWLNTFNAEKLEAQLQKQQHISIQEFTAGSPIVNTELRRFDRRNHLKLPPVDFYQLKIQYQNLVLEEQRDADAEILSAPDGLTHRPITQVKDFKGVLYETRQDDNGQGEIVTFSGWLYQIQKEGFDSVSFEQLHAHEQVLRQTFEEITTVDEDGVCRYRADCNQEEVRSRIRVAFSDKTTLQTAEDYIPETASLLRIENFTSSIAVANAADYFPAQEDVKKVMDADCGKIKIDEKTQIAIDALINSDSEANKVIAQQLIAQNTPLPEREKSYHYIPYHMDSGFEQRFFRTLVTLKEVADRGLEVYYNGDRGLTDFKIRCFRDGIGNWRYIGQYTPDFLILSRKDGEIEKVIIVETKGEGYAGKEDFKDKRAFTETFFKAMNNDAFGYDRFEYLYIEDSMDDNSRVNCAIDMISAFFGEVK